MAPRQVLLPYNYRPLISERTTISSSIHLNSSFASVPNSILFYTSVFYLKPVASSASATVQNLLQLFQSIVFQDSSLFNSRFAFPFSNRMDSHKVLIIGCGVAGPVIALFFKRKGYSPTVLERSKSSGYEGSALSLAPNGYVNVLPYLADPS